MTTDLTTIDEGAVLRIVYETDELVSVRTVGMILDRLGAAFDAYAKASVRFRGTRLAVIRIETGSLVASLVAVGEAVETLIKQREAIGGFLNHINDVVQMMLGNIPGTPKAADRKAVEAISGPIATGNARAVTFNVIGNGNIINFDENVIREINKNLDRGVNAAASIARTDDSASFDFIEKPKKQNIAAHSLVDMRKIESGVEGEAIKVRGNWYVRLDDQDGVMHPADLEPGVELAESYRYRFTGKWNAVRYDIASAVAI